MPWLARDLRLALRVLRKEVAFTALAVLTLGLGIGAATTIFSVIDAVQRNVALEVRDLSRAGAGGRAFFKLPELLDYKERIQSFEDVIAAGFTDVLYATAQGTEQFTGALMSGNNFAFLGIPAARGRTLLPEDARPGAPPVCVMRHTTWATRFGSDPGVLGRTLVLNGVPTTLVGIMPPRFQKMAADFYLPVSLDRAAILVAPLFLRHLFLRPAADRTDPSTPRDALRRAPPALAGYIQADPHRTFRHGRPTPGARCLDRSTLDRAG